MPAPAPVAETGQVVPTRKKGVSDPEELRRSYMSTGSLHDQAEKDMAAGRNPDQIRGDMKFKALFDTKARDVDTAIEARQRIENGSIDTDQITRNFGVQRRATHFVDPARLAQIAPDTVRTDKAYHAGAGYIPVGEADRVIMQQRALDEFTNKLTPSLDDAARKAAIKEGKKTIESLFSPVKGDIFHAAPMAHIEFAKSEQARISQENTRQETELENAIKKAPQLTGFLNNILERNKDKAPPVVVTPQHEANLRAVTYKSLINDIISNDPVLSAYAPAQVIDVANQIATMIPSLATNPLMMRSAVAKYLISGGHLDPMEIDQWLKTENTSRQLRIR